MRNKLTAKSRFPVLCAEFKKHEAVLIGSCERLKMLQSNVTIFAIKKYINELREFWNPRMRTLEGKPYDGPVDGEEPFNVLYWDVANAKWTNRDAAFKSYVFQSISKFI